MELHIKSWEVIHLKNLRIRTKLIVIIAVFIVALGGLTGCSLYFMNNINQQSTVTASNWLPSVITSEELNTLTSDFRILEMQHVISQDEASMKELESMLKQKEAEIAAGLEEYVPLITNDTDKKMLEDAKKQWNQYITLHETMIEYSRNNQTDQAMSVLDGESKSLFDTASATFLELVEFNTNGAEQSSQEGDRVYASAFSTMVAAVIVIIIAVIILSLIIILSITRPVAELDHVARQIAEGNLNESIKYESRDELGKLAANFNKTVVRLKDYVNYIDEISKVLDEVANGNLEFELTYDYAGEFAKVKAALLHISDSLNETLSDINQSADQVAVGSDQVSSGAQLLAQGATEQASSVEELAATINVISENVKSNADNAKNASKMAGGLGETIQESNNRMQEMIHSMQEISDTSNEISKIIKLIEDISFQTNILALNAAVEAARAGAAGKGFAVVAGEVRSLANKSSEAASNTTVLIENSIKAVNNGTKIADDTAAILKAVVEDTRNVLDTVNMISNASNEQATAIAQVTEGIGQISNVVQTNSATAEESAAASEELSGQSQILKGLVERFKLKDQKNSSTVRQISLEENRNDGFSSSPASSGLLTSKY